MLMSNMSAKAQYVYGTTGLLHMPTADMQEDKTVMCGASYLDVEATPGEWDYNTWNYYLNVTIFPWLEIGYTCTLFKIGIPNEGYSYKFRNQDRHFDIRLRVWKEGWYRDWTPQVVLGTDDPGTTSFTDSGVTSTTSSVGNGYWSRFYLAVTKHFAWQNIGELGIHAAYVYNRRRYYHLNGPAVGVNFRLRPMTDTFLGKVANGLNLMAEYDARTMNCGLMYSLWKEHINVQIELTGCRHLSAGIMLKTWLK
ncbi:MAG: YjbH domain-containing protein [Bacteroides sp.]|nr:YjbH domain-containing protein [Bacteroides sp.]